MVGVARLFKGAEAFGGQGFRIDFSVSDPGPLEIMRLQGVVVRGASVEAVYRTTEEVKERIRDYIDAHFGGSEFHGNGRRRVSNASAQSKYYDEVGEKGQYAGLVYSTFGKRDAGGFVDYLLLHIKGGTIKPKKGDWLRLRGPDAGIGNQSGFYPGSRSDIFFTESEDGKKLFQLRRYRKGSPKSGKTELLATLVRQVTIPGTLTGIEAIAKSRADLFDKNFRAALERDLPGGNA